MQRNARNIAHGLDNLIPENGCKLGIVSLLVGRDCVRETSWQFW